MKRILVLLFLLALIPIACADPTADSLSVSSASGDLGDTKVPVLLNITNTADGPIQGIAFDVIYDHGALELVKARRGSDLPTDDGDPTWTVKLGGNQQSITMYTDSHDFALADGTTGNIVQLQFDVNATAIPGDYPIELSGIAVSSTDIVMGTIPAINGTFTVNNGGTAPVLCTTPDPPSHDFGGVPEGETRTWTFGITNCGGEGTLDWTVADDQDWLTVSPESGSDAGTVTVTIDTTGLAVGAHTGTITVGSSDGTKTGSISLTVPDSVVDPVLCTDPDPPSHDFGKVKAGKTRAWTFDITNCGEGTLDWTVTDDQDWITVSPESGSDAGTVTVTIDTTGLDGAYTGTITVGSSYGAKTGSISVTVPPMTEAALISIGDGCGIVTIPIEIGNGVNVGACDIMLSYDPAIVNVTGVTGGDMDVTVANLEHAGDGWVRIGTYQTDDPGLSGQITFANVAFEPVGSSGNCSLNLSVTTFKDATPEGNEMPYVVSNGTYMALLNGDVNGDGVVDMYDAMYLAKHVLDKAGFEVIITEAADVNDDKVIDIADSMHIAKHVLEIAGFEELR